ncbi:MAG: hypothetical protein C0501_11390 [Isosphaera sp.]|nr:hypothetical protein [Isosphaera sp.]
MAALLSGCVERVESGQEVTFRYATWVTVVVVAVAAGAVVLTWLLRKTLGLGGGVYWLTALWLVLAAGAAPTWYLSHATVSDQGFENRCGIWGEGRVRDARFAEVKAIRVSTVESGVGRSRREDDTAEFLLHDGQVKSFPASWFVEREALEELITRAKAKGIPVRDERGR